MARGKSIRRRPWWSGWAGAQGTGVKAMDPGQAPATGRSLNVTELRKSVGLLVGVEPGLPGTAACAGVDDDAETSVDAPPKLILLRVAEAR